MSKVPAAENTLRILEYLGAQRGPMPAASIAHALGLPRSSVYHLLTVLLEHGFVLHFPEAKRYGLGVATYELSSAFSRQEPLTRLGRPILAGLVDAIGESGHVAVLHGRDVVYIAEERAPRRPRLVTDVGVRLPSHLTASGRALLATLPAGQLRALYPDAGAFEDRTGAGPHSYAELKRVVAAVRETGYATEDGEVTPGFASVAVSVRDHAGWPAAGIAITFPRENLPREEWPGLAARIAEAAAELSRRIRGS
ncbi:IclR family transcriptional regulator [Leifsonia poae]|uniref:Glycerol operon regulatory protein n=1 Tax=Leifsonia poae TaxID=110933 RepID=A0A9W6H8G0_9MICO|nr:IclR family transcriptional regulator [Leifsonia poae]GLJ75491.1 IclR family transcriptional regulator [Leifsonia poae]